MVEGSWAGNHGEYSCSRSTRLPMDVGSALSLLSCASLDARQDAICYVLLTRLSFNLEARIDTLACKGRGQNAMLRPRQAYPHKHVPRTCASCPHHMHLDDSSCHLGDSADNEYSSYHPQDAQIFEVLAVADRLRQRCDFCAKNIPERFHVDVRPPQ